MADLIHTCLDPDHDGDCPACAGAPSDGSERAARLAYLRSYRQTPRGKALRKAHQERADNREIARDRSRAFGAARDGYAPAPLERDCPPRPADGRCDCCLSLVTGTGKLGFVLDHDHVTGAFRGWCCMACNRGSGIVDNPERLRTRADFLDLKLPWQ